MNKYQIAGYDNLERGFSRDIEIHNRNGEFFAIFQYEKFLLKVKFLIPRQAEKLSHFLNYL